jgi:DNA polymerase-1
MAFGKGHHLHLVDGSAFIFRAYHALPPLTRKSDGLPIGAVSGFCNMLWNQIIKSRGRCADPCGGRLRQGQPHVPQRPL